MGRIRTIKPELFQHEPLYELEIETGLPVRFAFVGMLTQADREGRFLWRPRTLKLGALPYDEGVDFAHVLEALHDGGFIYRYEVDGETYGAFPTWNKHQFPNAREARSKIPPPDAKAMELHVHARARTGNARALHGNARALHVHARAFNASQVVPPAFPHDGESPPDMADTDEDEKRTCMHVQAHVMHVHARGEGEGEGIKTLKPIPKEALAVAPLPARDDRLPSPLVKEEKEEPEKPEDAPAVRPNHRAAAICLLLRSNGIEGATPANPHVVEWADNPRITDDVLLAAAAMAKNREGVRRPGPNYLAPIIAQLLDPPKPKPKRDDWDRTDAGISRKARELGISARAGESYASLKDRVFDAIRRSANGHHPGA